MGKRQCKERPWYFVPPYRTGKNSLSVSADFILKEVLQWKKSNEKKNVMRRKECSKIYWKYLLCVYIFVLPPVWIRGVWEKTLILRTFCIWPWRCLSLSLSDAAFFDGTGPTDPIYDFFKSPIWNTTTSISIQFLPTLKKNISRSLSDWAASSSIVVRNAFWHSAYEFFF